VGVEFLLEGRMSNGTDTEDADRPVADGDTALPSNPPEIDLTFACSFWSPILGQPLTTGWHVVGDPAEAPQAIARYLTKAIPAMLAKEREAIREQVSINPTT
jgi:hypothetical protein